MRQTNASKETMTSAPSHSPHVVGKNPELFNQILNPGVNLCLWQRPIESAVSQEIESIQIGELPDVRCITTFDSFDADVCTLLQQQGLVLSAFERWRHDMQHLASLYFKICGNRDVTMRLLATETDDCRRFHFDRTHLRMLCTYQGPGTEWLHDDQVDREAQSNGAPNEEIIRYGEPAVFEPFWVGILKGDVYPGNAGHGLVHRSPPIAYSGKTRVLFCLDS